MAEPSYQLLQKKDIPELWLDGNKVIVHIIFGNWKGTSAPFDPYTDIHLAQIDFKESGKAGFFISKEKNILFYVIKGMVKANNREIQQHQLVLFAHDDEPLEITAINDALILFGHATPFRDPFIAHGPFVMNTREEIVQAYKDYNDGKFGNETSFE